jgi:hypothetical protein
VPAVRREGGVVKEIWRVDIKTDQRISIIIARQDPAVLGPDARDVVTTIPVRPGDVLLVVRPEKTP